MRSERNHFVSRLLAAIILFSGLNGCAEMRTVTYPKNFIWLGKAEVRSVMHRFAESMERIDLAAKQQKPGDKVLIIEELEIMIDEAQSIMASRETNADGTLLTNHLLIDDHLEHFLEDLAQAKSQMEIQPDSYYLVGNLTGNCSGCHRYR